jgi:NDP-sugar pyrophosphorylase family protein
MEPDVIELVPKGEFFDFPDLVRTLLAEGEPVGAYDHDGLWFDIGRQEDYERAINVWLEDENGNGNGNGNGSSAHESNGVGATPHLTNGNGAVAHSSNGNGSAAPASNGVSRIPRLRRLRAAD